jgi:hypothetical protein
MASVSGSLTVSPRICDEVPKLLNAPNESHPAISESYLANLVMSLLFSPAPTSVPKAILCRTVRLRALSPVPLRFSLTMAE